MGKVWDQIWITMGTPRAPKRFIRFVIIDKWNQQLKFEIRDVNKGGCVTQFWDLIPRSSCSLVNCKQTYFLICSSGGTEGSQVHERPEGQKGQQRR